MSYILDALKKADAERERGAVPGVLSQQRPFAPIPAKTGPNLKPMLALIAGLLLLIVAGMVWRFTHEDTQTLASTAPAPLPTPVSPASTAAPLPAAPLLAPPPQPLANQTATGAPTPETAAAKKAAPSKPAKRVYTLAELPDNVRQTLPQLKISGGSYSSNPAQRMLIVNNEVFQERSQPAPGVTVEQIRQNSAVLLFRGYSFRVPY